MVDYWTDYLLVRGMNRILITKEQRDFAHELRKQGKSWEWCGIELGVNEDSLRRSMQNYGYAMVGRPTIPLTDIAFAYELRCMGLSWKAITKYIDYDRTSLIKGIARRMAA